MSPNYVICVHFFLLFIFKFMILMFVCCSGKTEFQTTQQNRARRTVQFERRPSQRYARRQSHVLRERQRLEFIYILFIVTAD